MHPRLARQLKSLDLSEVEAPSLSAFQALLACVDRAYLQADQDLDALERTIQVSTAEIQARYDELHRLTQDELDDKSARLEKSLALANAIQDATLDGILVVDDQKRIVCVNRRFADLAGIPLDVLRTLDLDDLFNAVFGQLARPDEVRARVQHLDEHPMEVAHGELPLADGRVFERFTGPVLSENGVWYGRLWTLRDVTERRRIEVERLVLAERMASMGRLAASVAHEINNPLAYVMSHVEHLASSAVGATHDPAVLAELSGGLDRIRLVVHDLKTLTRTEEESRVALNPIEPLEASLQMASNAIRHRARLVRDLAPTPPVLANAARLGQVFLNLLTNAADALPEGHAEENTITVQTRHEPANVVRIAISDTGSGIPLEHRERIFDPFFTTKPIGSGTGLGLSICKSIVEAHGGSITVRSEVGVGTTFVVELPVCAPPVPTVPTAVPPSEHPQAPRRARVLIIDDEPLIGASIVRLLRRDHDASALLDAREALRLFAEGERFDVIFCDLMMPHLTGAAFHAEVAAKYPEILPHLVFLSGGAFAPAAEAFLRTTAVRLVEKPFTRSTLLAAIDAVIG